jgi:hypothetical protein
MASTSSSGESLTPSSSTKNSSTVGSASTSSPNSIAMSSSTGGIADRVEEDSPGILTTATSSSEKKTTKLSTGSVDLNSSSASDEIQGKDTGDIGGNGETANFRAATVYSNKVYENNVQHPCPLIDEDEAADADEDEIATEEACSATTVEVDVKNKTSSSTEEGGGSHNEDELHEFSSSSASSISTSSGFGVTGNKFTSRRASATTTRSSIDNNNNIDASHLMESSDEKVVQKCLPPIINTSRKREHNRRKCSDPMSVKKLPRMEESDEEDHYDFDDFYADDDDDGDEDDADGYDEDYRVGRGFSNYDIGSGKKNRRKQRCTRSTRINSSNGTRNQTIAELTARSTLQNQRRLSRSINSNNASKDKVNIPLAPLIHDILNEKETEQLHDIHSSVEEYETCITESNSDYNLKWKNHETQILLAFEALLESETFCDVTLVCDTEETKDDEDDDEVGQQQDEEVPGGKKGSSSGGVRKLKAHRIVLSACSEYFQRIFADNPCKHPVIVLKDFQAWEIQALLDFMYRGEVTVSLERLDVLVKSAESLQVSQENEKVVKKIWLKIFIS